MAPQESPDLYLAKIIQANDDKIKERRAGAGASDKSRKDNASRELEKWALFYEVYHPVYVMTMNLSSEDRLDQCRAIRPSLRLSVCPRDHAIHSMQCCLIRFSLSLFSVSVPG